MNHIYILCFPFGRFRPFSGGKWFPFGPVYIRKTGPNGKSLAPQASDLACRPFHESHNSHRSHELSVSRLGGGSRLKLTPNP